MEKSVSDPGRRPDLEWLKALAALEVVVCHSDLAVKHFSGSLIARSWYLPLSGIGVEVFFVVSGYLICLRAPAYANALSFLRARLLRLMPLYALFTGLAVAARLINPAWAWNRWDVSAGTIIGSFLILPQPHYPIVGVGWSLEHEVIFYALVALLILATRLAGEAPVWFGLALFGLGWCGALVGIAPSDAAWYLHPVSVLMTGFAAGWLYRCHEVDGRVGVAWLLMACLAVTVTLSLGTDPANTERSLRLTGASALVILFVALRDTILRLPFADRILFPLGLATYSIYLSHWFTMSALGKAVGRLRLPESAQLPVRLAVIAVAVGVGLLVYRLLERPLDRWLRAGVPIGEAFRQPFRRRRAMGPEPPPEAGIAHPIGAHE